MQDKQTFHGGSTNILRNCTLTTMLGKGENNTDTKYFVVPVCFQMWRHLRVREVRWQWLMAWNVIGR